MTLLFSCAMVYLGMNLYTIQLAYIIHVHYPGGPTGFELSFNPTTTSLAVTTGVLEIIIQTVTMTIQVGPGH